VAIKEQAASKQKSSSLAGGLLVGCEKSVVEFPAVYWGQITMAGAACACAVATWTKVRLWSSCVICVGNNVTLDIGKRVTAVDLLSVAAALP
jgi:hypothetical protein